MRGCFSRQHFITLDEIRIQYKYLLALIVYMRELTLPKVALEKKKISIFLNKY